MKITENKNERTGKIYTPYTQRTQDVSSETQYNRKPI
jgi:hypothetical protein